MDLNSVSGRINVYDVKVVQKGRLLIIGLICR